MVLACFFIVLSIVLACFFMVVSMVWACPFIVLTIALAWFFMVVSMVSARCFHWFVYCLARLFLVCLLFRLVCEWVCLLFCGVGFVFHWFVHCFRHPPLNEGPLCLKGSPFELFMVLAIVLACLFHYFVYASAWFSMNFSYI